MSLSFDESLNAFIDFLKHERRVSEHTVRAYRSDLKGFIRFLDEFGFSGGPGEVSAMYIRRYIATIHAQTQARTRARKLSALRSYYKFLVCRTAVEENVDVIGISLLSGSHNEIIDQLFEELESNGAKESIPVILGGIIPTPDFQALQQKGVKRIFTPKDFDLMAVMNEIMDIINAQKSQ